MLPILSAAGLASMNQLTNAKNQLNSLSDYFTDPVNWTNWVGGIIKVLVIWIVGRIIIKIAQKAITHMMVERERSPLRFDPRRTRTIGRLIENTVSYVVNFITILLVVSQLGFNLGPLLAGAGVLGLAIGFGAQSMVKDVITGFFIIFEDQFAVGDTIQTGAFKGTVEAIGLRVTTLRTWTGEVHIIPNGTIAAVTNFSVHNSLAVIDISFSYEDDMEKTQQVLKGILHNLHEAHDNIVKEPEILGIQTLGDSNFTLRIVAECKPNTQGTVTRVLNEGIKKALLEKQMEVPKINYSPTEKGG